MSETCIIVNSSRFLLCDMRNASGLIWATGIAFFLFFLLCLSIAFWLWEPSFPGNREAWARLARFCLTGSIHLLVVTAALTLLPPSARNAADTQLAAFAVAMFTALEMVLVSFLAAVDGSDRYAPLEGFARHMDNAVQGVSLAGMAATAFIGLLLLRRARQRRLAKIAGWSFILGAGATMWLTLQPLPQMILGQDGAPPRPVHKRPIIPS